MNKKVIGVLLVAIVLISAVVLVLNNNSSSEFEDKWVLTSERTVSETGELNSEKTYTYNEKGLLLESVGYEYYADYTIKDVESFTYGNDQKLMHSKYERSNSVTGEIYTSESTDYFYDNDDNCITAQKNSGGEISTYNYEYNSNNKVSFEKILSGNVTVRETTYEYDEYNNMIKSTERTFLANGNYHGETVCTNNNIYNGSMNLIECERIVDFTKSNDMYLTDVDKYYDMNTFDEYGNNLLKKTYTDSLWICDTDDKITRKGTEFALYEVTYYTYSKVSDLTSSLDKEAISQDDTTYATTVPTTTPKKLSDECDEVLATGTNSNGDYYEIVANKIEDYTGLSIYVGVIKNNEWLLEPTKDMPFVSEKNTFNWNGPETGEVHYVGNNCFVSMKKSKGGSSSPFVSYAYMYIAYNVETGKSYSTAGYEWSFRKEIPLICSEEDEHMIIGYDGYAGVTEFHILNKSDMTVSDVCIEGHLNSFANISEGVFSIALGESNYPKHYIYDINGNIILDLSEYKTYGHQNVYFTDGKCNLEIINNNDTKYRLTINKKGEVLDNEVVYE